MHEDIVCVPHTIFHNVPDKQSAFSYLSIAAKACSAIFSSYDENDMSPVCKAADKSILPGHEQQLFCIFILRNKFCHFLRKIHQQGPATMRIPAVFSGSGSTIAAENIS